MNLKKRFFIFTIAVILTLGLSISLQSILAAVWVGPTDTAPGNNVPPPIFNQHSTPNTSALVNIPLGISNDVVVSGGGDLHILQGSTGGGNINVDNDVNADRFLYSSDARLKENVNTIPSALDKVLQLEGVEFNWKKDGRADIGVIAQDVEEIFPQAVNTNSEGYKSVEYGNLVAPLIEAIKEQQVQIDELKAQVEDLKTNCK